jgi:phage terminase large subunit
VLRVPELVQVATFQGRIAPDDFADALYTLGKTYNWAWICPETNTPGIATVLRLDGVLNYPNVYQRQVMDSQSGKFIDKAGWQTNRLTKPLMVTDLRGAIRDDLILFKDAFGKDMKFEGSTLDQLMHYVQGKDGKMGAVSGRNDDLVLALALALQMSINMGFTRLGKGKEGVEAPAAEAAPAWSFEWWAQQAEDAEREQYAA